MKVNIGPYIDYFGPNQIAEKILFWLDREDCKVLSLANFLKGKNNNSKLAKLCSFIYEKRKRTVKVKIDSYDLWNLDHTLALVILPALQNLRDNIVFFVCEEDIPIEILKTISSLDDDSKIEFKSN